MLLKIVMILVLKNSNVAKLTLLKIVIKVSLKIVT